MNKTISREFNGEDYTLIIMEKAILRDLGKLTEFYYKHNLLKLIFEDPFYQKIGDNFLKRKDVIAMAENDKAKALETAINFIVV